MTTSDHDWQPDPQLLAAYFDGELRDDPLCTRVEAWVAAHPDAGEDADALKKLWLDTTPAEPSEAAWRDTLARIEARRPQPSGRWLWFGAAASIMLIGASLGLLQALTPTQKVSDRVVHLPDVDVLPVALASEITILRFEGPDTDSVIVGEMPVSGELELADSGQVCISCKCPRVVVRQDPPHRPMVWARADVD